MTSTKLLSEAKRSDRLDNPFENLPERIHAHPESTVRRIIFRSQQMLDAPDIHAVSAPEMTEGTMT